MRLRYFLLFPASLYLGLPRRRRRRREKRKKKIKKRNRGEIPFLRVRLLEPSEPSRSPSRLNERTRDFLPFQRRFISDRCRTRRRCDVRAKEKGKGRDRSPPGQVLRNSPCAPVCRAVVRSRHDERTKGRKMREIEISISESLCR